MKLKEMVIVIILLLSLGLVGWSNPTQVAGWNCSEIKITSVVAHTSPAMVSLRMTRPDGVKNIYYLDSSLGFDISIPSSNWSVGSGRYETTWGYVDNDPISNLPYAVTLNCSTAVTLSSFKSISYNWLDRILRLLKEQR
jgi:hypothetical protein